MPVKFAGNCPKHGLVLCEMKTENYEIHGPRCSLCFGVVKIAEGSKILGRRKKKDDETKT